MSCSLVIIDNFYNNPHQVRDYALGLDFNVSGNYPGMRTVASAGQSAKDMIQKFLPYKITNFSFENSYNGAFQYTTSQGRSWIHQDSNNTWAGVLYLTPDAPLSGGTGIYRPKYDDVELDPYDMTRWELVDRVGNVFNRLVLFDAKQYHTSLDYFGTNKENGRLFQLFFFDAD